MLKLRALACAATGSAKEKTTIDAVLNADVSNSTLVNPARTLRRSQWRRSPLADIKSPTSLVMRSRRSGETPGRAIDVVRTVPFTQETRERPFHLNDFLKIFSLIESVLTDDDHHAGNPPRCETLSFRKSRDRGLRLADREDRANRIVAAAAINEHDRLGHITPQLRDSFREWPAFKDHPARPPGKDLLRIDRRRR